MFSHAANLVDVGVGLTQKYERIWNALFVDNMDCGAFSWQDR
jgi:hypothetical protein